jgi:hypothetical protein
MVKPISLRLRNGGILAQARATLIRAGRGEELKQAHAAAVMRQARANVERRQEQDRLRRRAVLAAEKAATLIREVYQRQDQIDGTEYEKARWHAGRALILDELSKIIVQGRRP